VGGITGKFRAGVSCEQEMGIMVRLSVWIEQLPGSPGEEFWHIQTLKILANLLDDQAVDTHQEIGPESPFVKSQIYPVHPKGEFIFQPGNIRNFQTRAIADNKTTLAAVLIFQGGQLPDTFSSPGVQCRAWVLDRALDCISGFTEGIPDSRGNDPFNGFTNFMPPDYKTK
jgi:hypothetical protein